MMSDCQFSIWNGYSHGNKDPHMIKILKLSDFFLEVSANGLPEDFLPALRHLRRKGFLTFKSLMKDFLDDLYKMYKEHQNSFDPGLLSYCVLEG